MLEQAVMQDLIMESVNGANKELLVELVGLLASNNMYSYEVRYRPVHILD